MAQRYTYGMEVQVNVGRNNGNPITGSYAGRRWQGFTDGIITWKSFRIPWNAAENPQYRDTEMTFDLSKYAEAIGMTGWNWMEFHSYWIGFDFDAVIGHNKGLDQNELWKIQKALEAVPFVSIYTSTGGLGLHIYCEVDVPDVINHTEHAALGKAVLAKLTALSGVALDASVDVFGGNMWVWHKRANHKDSYSLLKHATEKCDVPSNWRDYLTSVNRKSRISRPITDKDKLAASYRKCSLDNDHTRLLNWFEKTHCLWWFDESKNMLVCHTSDLKKAHQHLQLKGFFETIAKGREDEDQNCFCFPQSGGSWSIRRHTRGCAEHSSWYTDNSGWTTCYFNALPTLRTVSRIVGGIEGEKEYSYRDLKEVEKALFMMGIDFEIPKNIATRQATIKQGLDGKLIVSMNRMEGESLEGWIQKQKTWEKVYHKPETHDPIELPDNLLRHVVSQGTEFGWFIYSNGAWIREGQSSLRPALTALGHKRGELDQILGACILDNWSLVNKPFSNEYPGNREWNKNSAQFRFNAEMGEHPHWDLILKHIGANLDEACKTEWCLDYGITSGWLYLLAWISAMFKYPGQPLPYLFLYGPQNSGKSILHEGLSILFNGGYTRADRALTSQSGFNGELANAVLCVIEETNVAKIKVASDRIKDWVTGRSLSIRPLYKQPYEIANCTHWIQCSNDPSYCPILPGDTRIVVVQVDSIKKEIPKPELEQYLLAEAPAFLYSIVQFEIPDSPGRLRVPVLNTKEKQEQQLVNRSELEEFIEEHTEAEYGKRVAFKLFYDKFITWLPLENRNVWTKQRVAKQIPVKKIRIGGTIYLEDRIFSQPAACHVSQ